jgi:hypothetical protein
MGRGREAATRGSREGEEAGGWFGESNETPRE